jgi:GxxExxY protein
VEENRRLELRYKGRNIRKHFWIDLIVDGTLLIEVKSVAALTPVHRAQIITYLKLTACPVGLLINFNVPVLKDGIRRVVHPDLYVKQPAGPDVRSDLC